jgi:hypothetical protein
MKGNREKPWPRATQRKLALSTLLVGVSVTFLASGSTLAGGGCSNAGLEVNYAKGEVVFYYPNYGRLVFESAEVCDTAECVSAEGPLAGCPYVNLTLEAACGVDVGRAEKPENAFYVTSVTVQKRISSRGGGNGSGHYSLVMQNRREMGPEFGGFPISTYPCSSSPSSVSSMLEEGGDRALARLIGSGFDTYELTSTLAGTDPAGPGLAQRDTSCVYALVAKWAHQHTREEVPLCATGAWGGEIRWTAN